MIERRKPPGLSGPQAASDERAAGTAINCKIARFDHSVNNALDDSRVSDASRFLKDIFGESIEGHHLNIWTLENKTSRWFTDLSKAAMAAVNLSEFNNVYYQLGLQPRDLGPKGRGKAITASGIPGLWQDIDILGPAHKSQKLPPDTASALALLDEFPLKPSVIIHSGHGLQPLWLFKELWMFDDAQERNDACNLARAFLKTFQARASAHGWIIDATADLARVLRVAGTINRKANLPPVPVAILDWHPERRYSPEDFEPFLLSIKPIEYKFELARNNGFPAANFAAIVESCGFMNHWRQDATDLSEPEWYAGITVAARCHDGRKLCHAHSAPYDGYSQDETESKIDHALEDTGPLTCDYIAEQLSAGQYCGDCQHRGRVKSPIALGRSFGPQLVTPDGESARPTLLVDPVRVDEPVPMAPHGFVLECLNQEEYGDARLLSHLYKGRLVHDHGEKAWYFWSGHAWRKDRAAMVKRLVAGQLAAQYLHLAAELTRDAAGDPDPKSAEAKKKRTQAEQLTGRAFGLRKLNRTQNVLQFAASLLGITGDEWDRNPYTLAVPNGVVDLRTGKHRPGDPSDYIRTQCPTEWKGLNEPAPRWERFLEEVLESDAKDPLEKTNNTRTLIGFLYRLLGYGCVGLTVEHRLPVFWGIGRNGKDTLLETLKHTLGDVAGPVSADVLLAGHRNSGAAQPHLCDLQGKRIAWVSETNEGAQLNAGQVKLITGGGIIKTRPLYGNMIQFDPTHLLMLITNAKPRASADDYALWKRLLLIPFTRSFVDKPDSNKPNERQADPHLKDTLFTEASGVLAWLVRGCLAWQQEGLNPPETVLLATEQYRDEEDTLKQFVDECCIQAPAATIAASRLYTAFVEWSGDKKVTATAFGKRMGQRFKKDRREKGMVYLGLGLLAENPVVMPLTDSEPDALSCRDVGSVGADVLFPHVGQTPMGKSGPTIQTIHTLQGTPPKNEQEALGWEEFEI